MTAKFLKFKVNKVDMDDDSRNGRVIYTVSGKAGREEKTYDIEYRPTIDFFQSGKQLPKEFLQVHIESRLINELELKESGVKYQGVRVEWAL